jgi:hypothetical protein
VKAILAPEEHKTKRFVKQQEACRKYVERQFSVLQSRRAIVHHPARTLSVETMGSDDRLCKDEHDEGLHHQGWQF